MAGREGTRHDAETGDVLVGEARNHELLDLSDLQQDPTLCRDNGGQVLALDRCGESLKRSVQVFDDGLRLRLLFRRNVLRGIKWLRLG